MRALTDQEIEALRHAAYGFSTNQLAQTIKAPKTTVLSRLSRARNKLGARNLTHAVVLAIKAGLIAP